MTHSTSPLYSRGQIILLALVLAGVFAMVSTALVGFVNSYGRAERVTVAAAQALAIAEGALENAIGKLNQNPAYAGETNITLGPGTFTITVESIDSATKRITATGSVPNSSNPTATKIVKADAGINNATISFHYGIQSGNGGFSMDNSSLVRGNVFSSGSVIGTSQNYIYGDVVSSGPNGLVYGIHATSSVYAHTIGNASENTIIDKNAYYASTNKTNTTVRGTSFPGSPDQPIVDLPISDDQINQWEAAAAAGGTATCSGGSYSLSGSQSATLGPIKIPCNLVMSNSSVLTVTGHIWVTGNITVQNSAKVKMDPALGATNVAIIADNPANRLTNSTIKVKNTSTFENSGTPGSFVFLISQNNSAETGGDEEAFELSNSASALVAYAAHGLIPLENMVSLKEVTAYKIRLKNSANVTYDSGLPSAVFESGPGGSWAFVPGSYAITR
ncbi:MAG: hypothetical protein NUV90_01905 [Candidatus Parcubacteria bacterium]|nr:hypothetical protein [Candidatus Parcubacteria bacterium]